MESFIFTEILLFGTGNLSRPFVLLMLKCLSYLRVLMKSHPEIEAITNVNRL